MSSFSPRATLQPPPARPRARNLTLDCFRREETGFCYVTFPGLWRALVEAASVVAAALALTLLVLVSLPS